MNHAAVEGPFSINVPELHAALASGVPAGNVLFFDPGTAPAGDSAFFSPGTLPLDRREAAGLAERFAQLARETRDPRELSGLWSSAAEDFYSSTTFAIRDQMADMAAGVLEEKRLRQALVKAQSVLCLAWALEEAALDLSRLEDRLDGQWKRFEHELGLDEDDQASEEGRALLGEAPASLAGITGLILPKALVLESILAFVPPSAGLVSADAELIALWAEYGVRFTPADQTDLAVFGLDPPTSGRVDTARASGHLLALSRRPEPAKPWLSAPRAVFVPRQ